MNHTATEPPRKRRRVLVRIAIALLLCCAAPFLVSGAMCLSVQHRILAPDEAAALDADCILVLGALVREGGELSGILEDRLVTAIAAYESGASDRLLVSGDHGRADYDEVNAMKSYAVANGVAAENVFMDHAGFSTYESLYRARDIFLAEKVIVVTQRYHLYRALYVARSMGIEAYGIASDLHVYSGMPYFTAREILARNKDFFYALFMPKPTYLGPAIPIWSDAALTNG